jgi:hypothetical protein
MRIFVCFVTSGAGPGSRRVVTGHARGCPAVRLGRWRRARARRVKTCNDDAREPLAVARADSSRARSLHFMKCNERGVSRFIDAYLAPEQTRPSRARATRPHRTWKCADVCRNATLTACAWPRLHRPEGRNISARSARERVSPLPANGRIARAATDVFEPACAASCAVAIVAIRLRLGALPTRLGRPQHTESIEKGIGECSSCFLQPKVPADPAN